MVHKILYVINVYIYDGSQIHPIKERSKFIEKFMPRFLEQNKSI
jgi:hypothetical protein